MIKKIIMIAAAMFVATPAFGGTPSYSGHVVAGGRGGSAMGEVSIFAADFSGGSDPLGDFDLKLDTMIAIDSSTRYISMDAVINPKIAKRFKKILQRYTLVAIDPRGGVVHVRTKDKPSGWPFAYSSEHKAWLYRTSTDGGVTWSGVKYAREQN
jgi:hypothetical protein